jgi:putative lipoprotein
VHRLRLGAALAATSLIFSFFHVFAQGPVTSLGRTSWRLVKFQGSDDKLIAPDDRSKYTIAFGADDNMSVRVDCNRGHGTWKSSGVNQLEFGPLALTRAMCPPAPLNDRIPKDWQHVQSYTLNDKDLFLSLMADGGAYEFEPLDQETSMTGYIKGTAAYRERMALPSNAVFEATLEDISRADAPAHVIARVRIEHPRNSPIPFEITYDPSQIGSSRRYAVQARIVVARKVLFTTDQHYPAFNSDGSNQIALVLRRPSSSTLPNASANPSPGQPAGSGGITTSSLENTYWKLTRLGDAPVTATSQQREPHLILTSESRRVTGSGGCNRFSGSYELDDNRLTFSQMASTMMACLDSMETETAFLKTLTQVRTWKITGQQLELYGSGEQALLRLEARPMK